MRRSLCRLVAVAAVVVVAAACGGPDASPGRATATTPDTAGPTAPESSVRPSPTAPESSSAPSQPPSQTADPLPGPTPWTPADTEVAPEAKVAAARVVEALGTVPDSAGLAAGASADRLRAAGADPLLTAAAGVLVPPEAPAVARIVYPQYGGLTADRASVMVVVEQTWRDGFQTRSRTVTADVRLKRVDGKWIAADLRPVESAPAATSTPSAPVAALLDDPALSLPDAAHAELVAGVVAEPVVRALAELATSYDLSVAVFGAGHPKEVFGTDRISHHTRGRAVDVWAVDGRPIVTMGANDPALLAFLAAVRATGAEEIGGPADPDGPGGVHFANDLHRDHVHIGFDP